MKELYGRAAEEVGKSTLKVDFGKIFSDCTNGPYEECFDWDMQYELTIYEYVCDKLKDEQNEFDKVVFELDKIAHLRIMKKFLEYLQQRNLELTLPEELIRNKMQDPNFTRYHYFWPNNWFVHVYWLAGVKLDGEIPQDLWTLPNIEVLCIPGSQLEILPNHIGLLNNLKVLNVETNHIKNMPSILCLCTKLVELRMGSNRMRGLPACIRDLKNLEKITRHTLVDHYETNGLVENADAGGEIYIDLILENGDRVEITNDRNNEDHKKKPLVSPDSLYHQAAYKSLFHLAMHSRKDSNLSTLDVPKHIIDDIICSLPDLKFCYNCHNAFTGKEYYMVTKAFRDFKGYKNTRFEAVACSIVCCDSIFDKWTVITNHEKEHPQEEEIFCFDIDDSKDNDGIPKELNLNEENNNNYKWHQKLFSCFSSHTS
eukprot:gene20510-22528_t